MPRGIIVNVVVAIIVVALGVWVYHHTILGRA